MATPPRSFSCNGWVAADGKTADALGEATFIPEFKEAGLCIDQGYLAFGVAKGYRAAALFFAISLDQTLRTFEPFEYQNRCVIERVEQLTRTHIANRIRMITNFY